MNQASSVQAAGKDWNNVTGAIADILTRLLTAIPASGETHTKEPLTHARSLASSAGVKAAIAAGTLALPPGPWGLLTIVPDLYYMWRIQAQLVSDIAACYGKTASLTQETMLWCLFKHGGAQLLRDIVIRVGERYLVQRASLRVIQQTLNRLGISVTQRVLSRAVARWVPLIGAAGVGAYAFYDTTQVAKAAIELFSGEMVDEGGNG